MSRHHVCKWSERKTYENNSIGTKIGINAILAPLGDDKYKQIVYFFYSNQTKTKIYS